LNECENWSVTLSEEHDLRVLDSRALEGIFVFGGGGSDRELEKIAYNETVRDLCLSQAVIRAIKCGRSDGVRHVSVGKGRRKHVSWKCRLRYTVFSSVIWALFF
jgi:hypothetical protein